MSIATWSLSLAHLGALQAAQKRIAMQLKNNRMTIDIGLGSLCFVLPCRFDLYPFRQNGGAFWRPHVRTE